MITTLARDHLAWLARSRTLTVTALLTGAVVALVALITLHDLPQRILATSATLWLVATLAGLTTAARLLAAEEGTGGLRALMLAPVDRRDLFLARAVTSALVVLVLGALTWLLLLLVFPDLTTLATPAMAPALAAGALGLGAIGALTGWAALSSRGGELVGLLLAVPIAAPLVIACLHATEHALATGSALDPSLTFAAGYAAAVGAATYLVSGHVTEVP